MSTPAALPDLAKINRWIRNSPLNRWLGIEALSASPQEARLRIPWREEMGGVPQMTHGGIFACIADVAVFAAIVAASGKSGPTIDMRVDFHANAAGGEMLAIARTVKAGNNVLTGEVSIYDDRQRLLATGRCVFFNRPSHVGD